MSEFKCTGCGAEISFSAGTQSLKCEYCGAINKIERAEDRLPDSVQKVIPLAIKVDDLEGKVHEYMSSGDFTPDDMLEASVFTKKERLYVPAYFFSIQYEATWTATFGYDRKEHYTDFVTVTRNGHTFKEPVTKTKTVTDWRPQNGVDSGVVAQAAYAGKSLFDSTLAPADLVPLAIGKGSMTDLNPSFLQGVTTEQFAVAEEAAYASVNDGINTSIDRKVKSHAQGDHQRDWHWNAKLSHTTLTLYVPVCHAAFDYQGTEYHVWIDGVDGKEIRADKLPEDKDRKDLVNKGFMPAGASLAALVGASWFWSFTWFGLFVLLIAGGYGLLRRNALLGYSKNIRDSLLTQMRASSSSQAVSDEERARQAKAFQRPEKPFLAKTHLDKKLLPSLSAVAALAIGVPAYLDSPAHMSSAMDSAEVADTQQALQADVSTLSSDASAAETQQAEPLDEQVSFEGTLARGSQYSTIDADANDSSAPSVTFLNDSQVGSAIFAACQDGNRCQISGISKKGELIELSSVQSAGGENVASADGGENAVSPSFDCAKASTDAEHMICSDARLAAADTELATAYKAALSAASDASALRASQVAWRTQIRDACGDAECMLSSYQERLSMLTSGQM